VRSLQYMSLDAPTIPYISPALQLYDRRLQQNGHCYREQQPLHLLYDAPQRKHKVLVNDHLC